MGIIAVGLFSIPVGIIGDGFADWAQDNVAGGDDQTEDSDAPVPKRKLPKGGLGTVYCFLEGMYPPFHVTCMYPCILLLLM